MMVESRRWMMIGNFILFQVLWFAAIFGAASGRSLPVFVALSLLLLWGCLWRSPWRADLRMALAGLLVGLSVEPLWLSLGLIEYRLQSVALLPPAWILALWVGFAVTFNYSLSWLQGRLLLAAVFGASGSVLSVLAGVRFAAADAPAGLLPLALVYGAAWAVLVPALAWWAARGRRIDGDTRITDGSGTLA